MIPVLARKYRPQFFREVIGQDIFVRMIRNALAQGRIGHGFLLTGIRGVGKTTLARLLAKALSCADLQNEQEPCGVCPSCQALVQEKHLDIIEIDAASHTGVDDIRHILESCSYRAVMGPYKIFIIDEVHMLSKNAFNALLKTLEEPPAHVKFILATTEVNKVPLTVVSRCQQLHLKRLGPDHLVPYLKSICEKEGFEGETRALEILAHHSEGGVRDALSFLERAFLVAEDKVVTLKTVQSLLGLPSQDQIKELLQTILDQEVEEILMKTRAFYYEGLDPQALLSELLVVSHENTLAALKTPSTLSPSDWDRMWQLARKGWAEVATAPFPLACLEMILLRMAYMRRFPSPEEVLALIEPSPQEPSQRAVSSRESTPETSSSLTQLHKNRDNKELPPTPSPLKESPPQNPSPAHEEEGKASFDALLQALERQREGMLYTYLTEYVSFVAWPQGTLTLNWADTSSPCPPSLTAQLERFLNQWLQDSLKPCRVVWVSDTKGLTVQDQQQAYAQERKKKALTHPLLIKTKELFPDFILEEVKPL